MKRGLNDTALVMSISVSAFAASISITRDSSYSGTGDGNTYKYYKVFSASYTSNTSTGGGSTNGAPGDVSASAQNAAYTATAAVAVKLGSWATPVYYTAEDTLPEGKQVGDLKSGGWTRAEGNEWFDLTPIAGTTNYNVTWANSAETAETVQAAAAWLIDNEAYEAGPTALTFADGKWTSGNIDAGYYLVEGATGKNLVAATTDVTIAEKNVYPPLDKTQKDEEDGSNYGDATVDVAVGDVIDYQVKVTIPATAAVGDKILVYDNNSVGLTYNNDVAVTANTGKATVGESNYSGEGAVTGAAWQRLITVTDGSQGKDVVFSFTMTVNDSAIVDTGKENESGLKYGPGTGTTPWPYESTPDKVEYKTYFGGIEKVDGSNSSTKLANVEFTLKEGTNEFKVSKPSGKDYYIYDPAGSSTVVTATDGTIKIRGLDNNKTYTLTETNNPNAGYNMLAEPVTLTLSEDIVSSTTYTPVAAGAAFDANTTYYTKNGDNYVEATGLAAFEDGVTYYTAETTGSSSYDGTTADTWQDVVNNKGTVLPSTGGIGTTIFYVVGSILVVAAGVLLITKKRMSREG